MSDQVLWRGEEKPLSALPELLPTLGERLRGDLGKALPIDIVTEAAGKLSQLMLETEPEELIGSLVQDGYSREEALQTIRTVGKHFAPHELRVRLERELHTTDPQALRCLRYRERNYEAWAPLGVIVHVTPGNAATVAPLAILDGLLTGNINLAKLSTKEGTFGMKVLKALVDQDPTRTLAAFVYMIRVSSKDQDTMMALFEQADAISAWGGEAAIESIRKMAPKRARMIEWGHKLSFGYLSASEAQSEECLKRVAKDVCEIDQQACSSPQCLFVDTDQPEVLGRVAAGLASAMKAVSSEFPPLPLGDAEQAEITTVRELHDVDVSQGQGQLIEAEDHTWRILVDYRSWLSASPLFRTIWLRPLPRSQIIEVLRPLRSYLQTAGVGASTDDLPEVSRLLLAAGVTRITPVGSMTSGYLAEPHDGVVSLTQFVRRVSLRWDDSVSHIADFSDFAPRLPAAPIDSPIMGKEAFQQGSANVPEELSQIYFESGGSSGTPKVSVFTYADLRTQMRGSADGHLACGLDPARDRCMNLMYAGHMYGGFISKFMALEELEAAQFPMGRVTDTEVVAQAIIRYRVNTLLGMPSYLMQLLSEQRGTLKEYGGLRKLYYGGEHFEEKQQELLKADLGIQLIRSIVYGATDTGPMAHTCPHCKGSEHHVLTQNVVMEIVDVEKDEPVPEGGVGRILVTCKWRQGQSIRRYELGDLGRWVKEPCGCGRTTPKFELLGRHGDVFRIGESDLLNFNQVRGVLADELKYVGEIQLIVEKNMSPGVGRLTVRIEADRSPDTERAHAALLSAYPALRDVVEDLRQAVLKIEAVGADGFELTRVGKVKNVLHQS